jgi:hypothetical protein
MTITLLVLDLLRVLLVLFLLLYVLVLIENFYDGRIYRLSDENKWLRRPFGYPGRVWKSTKLETRYTLLRRRLTLDRARKLRNHKFAARVQTEDQINNPAVAGSRSKKQSMGLTEPEEIRANRRASAGFARVSYRNTGSNIFANRR